MKKLLMIAAVAALGFTSVNAQEEVSFGAKVGVNFATVPFSGQGVEDPDAITSFHIGATLEIPVSEKFSVQPELVYSSQGAKSEYSNSGYNSKSELTLNYINIPVLAKFYVTEGLSLEAGPQIGLLLKAEDESEYSYTDSSGSVTSQKSTDDVKKFYKGTDFALAFGAGYKFEGGLNLSARYNFGLSNIYDGSGDFKAKNNVFQLSVGYTF